MSRGFKALEDITNPDVTPSVIIDAQEPTLTRPISLADDYREAESLALPGVAPERVVTYWDGVRMLWLHGWFYYPFYSMATLHAALAVEFALKERFKAEGIVLSRNDGKLGRMLDIAVEREWLVPQDFSNVRRGLEAEKEWEENFGVVDEVDPEPVDAAASRRDAMERLVAVMKRNLKTLREFRNHRAHPKGLYVDFPGATYLKIEYARDLIAQLFRETTADE
jgi:hypothetical protein